MIQSVFQRWEPTVSKHDVINNHTWNWSLITIAMHKFSFSTFLQSISQYQQFSIHLISFPYMIKSQAVNIGPTKSNQFNITDFLSFVMNLIYSHPWIYITCMNFRPSVYYFFFFFSGFLGLVISKKYLYWSWFSNGIIKLAT